ncbi:MAG: molybdopterin molybdotransferase MoeA [Eggerthellaceae bacterium]|nr:molybdopterin molybdotransferase MoeA [Eggerthellaceae bacterium]
MAELVPIEQAQNIILDAVGTIAPENIALEHALGRTLAGDCVSDIDIAPFDNSAMDGFAFRAADLSQASEESPVKLEIVAYIPAGAYYENELQAGQCARIMTGAAVPAGADTVEMIERVILTGDGMVGDELILDHLVEQGKNVRYAGEEAKAGALVLQAGTTLDPAALGLLASTGNVEVSVYRKPVVGIISLGTELVEANEIPGPGQIRNSNRFALIGCIERAGGIARAYPIAPDNYDAIKDTLSQAANECDFVVSSGGAADGDFDFITQIAGELGEVFFKYVNMRPGKAQTFAVINKTPFLGLAGNPAAAICGFEMLVYPALQKMQGRSTVFHPMQRAIVGSRATKKDSRVHFQRSSLARNEEGKLVVSPYSNQSSALFSTFAESDCLLIVPGDVKVLEVGEEADIINFGLDSGMLI